MVRFDVEVAYLLVGAFMANEEHLRILVQGVDLWNRWREDNPTIKPELHGANLSGANLPGVKLFDAELYRANLRYANLGSAYLQGANLCEADLSGAYLQWAYLTRANLAGANLSTASLNFAQCLGADLSKANLREADLVNIELAQAVLHEANLSGANLRQANLSKADLRNANLTKACLESAILVETDLSAATLTNCTVYGVSAWGIKLANVKDQSNLRITSSQEPAITVDNLEVAQFVYLLLSNEKIRSVIDTIGEKGVLILGRFTEERKKVLNAIRNRLRELGFVPMMFDFEKPTQRDFTETIKTLAGLSRFIIADITNPKSSPLELQALMPDYMIPFVPILQEKEEPFAMFQDLTQKYGDWVLDVLKYDTADNLLSVLDRAVVRPALEKGQHLLLKKAQTIQARHVQDYM